MGAWDRARVRWARRIGDVRRLVVIEFGGRAFRELKRLEAEEQINASTVTNRAVLVYGDVQRGKLLLFEVGRYGRLHRVELVHGQLDDHPPDGGPIA